MSRRFCRVIPGKSYAHFAEAKVGGFIGTDFNLQLDLSGRLPDKWTDFNMELRPAYLKANPGKSRISAGMALGSIWTLSKWMRPDDVVLVPDGTGLYHAGEIEGEYFYVPAGPMPHHRAVRWGVAEPSCRTALDSESQTTIRATGSPSLVHGRDA